MYFVKQWGCYSDGAQQAHLGEILMDPYTLCYDFQQFGVSNNWEISGFLWGWGARGRSVWAKGTSSGFMCFCVLC